MAYDVNTIFQIAGIGIVVAMIHTVLKQMGKEDLPLGHVNWICRCTLYGSDYC